MRKEFVAIAEHICPVCGVQHTHNTEVLLHKRFWNIPDDKRVTGYGLCEEHDRLFEEGYIALIGAITHKNTNLIKLEDAHRTGEIVHMKRELFKRVFNTEVEDTLPQVFVDEEVLALLAEWNAQAKEGMH